MRSREVKALLFFFAFLIGGCNAVTQHSRLPGSCCSSVAFGPTSGGPTAAPFQSPEPPPVLSVPIGTLLWQQAIDASGKQPVAIGPFVYVIVANSKRLATYDSRSGTLRSTHSLGLDQIAAAGDALYGHDSLGHVVRIDPQSMRIRWSEPAGDGRIVADAAGPIFINAREIVAYRPDGAISWRRPLDGNEVLQGQPRAVGHKLLIPYFSDGAWLTDGFYSVDRVSGTLYGSYGPGRIVGLGGSDRAYAIEDYLGDLDDLCCTATLDTVTLDRTQPRGEPAQIVLARSSRQIEPDERENVVRVHPCDTLHLPNSISSQAILSKIGSGFAFWSVGRLYDISDTAIRRTGFDDECPIGESSGNAMLAARTHRLEIVTRRDGALLVSPVLNVERDTIGASLATPGRLYVEIGDWLYAIDPRAAQPIARWRAPCSQWHFVARTDRADILVCLAHRSEEVDRLYAFAAQKQDGKSIPRP